MHKKAGFDIINWKFFLASFLIGLIFIWFNDDKKKITVYPTPSNIGQIEYRDNAGNCYEYKMDAITCPSKKEDITTV